MRGRIQNFERGQSRFGQWFGPWFGQWFSRALHSLVERFESRFREPLERVFENSFYRFIFCLATIASVLIYAVVGSRMAEPPRWAANPFIKISETAEFRASVTPFAVDQINRSLQRLRELAEILEIHPGPLSFTLVATDLSRSGEIDRDEFERRILRLWIDEAAGFQQRDFYNLRTEIAAQALQVLMNPKLTREFSARIERLSLAGEFWYDEIQSLGVYCRSSHVFNVSAQSLCHYMRNHPNSSWSETPTPMSLTRWLTNQILLESESFDVVRRIHFVRKVFKEGARTEDDYGSELAQWPTAAASYGKNIQNLLKDFAPLQALQFDRRPVTAVHEYALDSALGQYEGRLQDSIRVEVAVLRSCESPDASQVATIKSAHVVWVRDCRSKRIELNLSAFRLPELEWSKQVERFAMQNSRFDFMEIGSVELGLALERSWIKPHQKLIALAYIETARKVAPQVRPQQLVWRGEIEARRIRAPIEVLKLVRLSRDS